MREEIITIGAEALVGEVAKLKVQGFRLVTLSCTEIDETSVDLLYHFDKDLVLKHLRLTALKGLSVPSISPVFFAALLVENEIQDFFGLRFDGLVVDYRGTLYLEQEAVKTPYCRFSLRNSDQANPPTETAAGMENP
ncbi:MAG: NADH-quinone oxidoreductase subunit C [Desulfobacteraceae bacterium]|nr:MAG: NADH-quinone oxidoreductase subunit C [Desulfobacteraceae bacterium]